MTPEEWWAQTHMFFSPNMCVPWLQSKTGDKYCYLFMQKLGSYSPHVFLFTPTNFSKNNSWHCRQWIRRQWRYSLVPLGTIKKITTIFLHKPAQNSLNHKFTGQRTSQNIAISDCNQGSIKKIVQHGKHMFLSTCNCIPISHIWAMLGPTLRSKSVYFNHKIKTF